MTTKIVCKFAKSTIILEGFQRYFLFLTSLSLQLTAEEQSDQLTTTQVTRSQSEQPANHEEFLDRPVTPDVKVSSCQYATQEITASVLPDSDEEAKQSQHSQK